MENNLDLNRNVDFENYIRNIVQQEILKDKIRQIKNEQISINLKRNFKYWEGEQNENA